jgi:glycosyltransferase involved in cell wall biosynthesis
LASANQSFNVRAFVRVDVCMLVSNDVRGDPRVTKEARALARAGYAVGVVGISPKPYMAIRPVRWEATEDGYSVCLLPHEDVGGNWERHHLTYFALDLMHVRDLFERPRLWRGVRKAVNATHKLQRWAGLETVRPSPWHPEPGIDPRLARQHELLMSTVDRHRAYSARMAMAAISVRPRVVHAHDLDTLEAGAWIARATGAALVFDAHEIFWQQLADGEAPVEWIEFYRALEAKLIHRADRVLTVSESIADFFEATHGIRRPLVIRNAIEIPASLETPPLRRSRAPVEVLFHGGLARDRGLEELVEAARAFEGAHLVIRGSGPIEQELRRLGGDRVRFEPPVPMAEVVAAASASDIGVIPYKPVCLNNRLAMPNKLFEYLAAGLAIAGSDLLEIRRIVEKDRVGVVLDPGSASSIALAVNRLAADPEALTEMRQRARHAAATKHNWAVDAEALVEMYRTLLPRSWRRSFVRLMTGRARI